jgi:uncharacterized membrane protein
VTKQLNETAIREVKQRCIWSVFGWVAAVLCDRFTAIMIRIEFELVRLRSWATSAMTSTLKSQTRIHYVVVGELSPRFAHMGPVLKLANFTSNFITNNQIASTRRTESSSSLLPSAKQIFEAPSGAERSFPPKLAQPPPF